MWRLRFARRNFEPHEAFERPVKSARYKTLFMGDSTAVGIGASRPELSVTGRFAARFPKMDITNNGVSGYKLEDLDNIMPENQSYDLLVLQIGANDILRFTRLSKAKHHLSNILKKAKTCSSQVVIIHSGNIGAGPLFPWPLKLIYDWRTRRFCRLYKRQAEQDGVVYVDIYRDLKSALAVERQQSTYGVDLFHPGDLGYKYWFKNIIKAINSTGFKLPDKLDEAKA